jgi:glycerol-3-phosphate dehydrogenase
MYMIVTSISSYSLHVLSMQVLSIQFDEFPDAQRGDSRTYLLTPGFPFIEAEVVYSVRHEFAVHAEDIISRRTRLAFINKEAALKAIPRVVELMANELGWDAYKQDEEIRRCEVYMEHFGGKVPQDVRVAHAAAV